MHASVTAVESAAILRASEVERGADEPARVPRRSFCTEASQVFVVPVRTGSQISSKLRAEFIFFIKNN
jgi:hypothetical protein